MTLLWCSSKFPQLCKLSLCIKMNIHPSLWIIDNTALLVLTIYLGLRLREIFLPSVQYLSLFHAEGWNIYNWRTSEASETLTVLINKFGDIYVYIFVYIYVNIIAYFLSHRKCIAQR